MATLRPTCLPTPDRCKAFISSQPAVAVCCCYGSVQSSGSLVKHVAMLMCTTALQGPFWLPAAGSHRDAVGVCGHEMRDPQLALFLARLLEPGNPQLQRDVIEDRLLPGPMHCLAATSVLLANQPRHTSCAAHDCSLSGLQHPKVQ